jgi:microcystin-dependent protein
MGTPFLGEIRLMAFNYAPKGWAQCNGQLLPINQNQALFSLLGTMYGGNGQTTFALPNFQGRVPMHVGSNTQGQAFGESVHTVTSNEMPQHTHFVSASGTQGNQPNVANPPTNNVLARTTDNVYQTAQNLTPLNAGSVTNVGGSQAHENKQPYLVLNFCVALQGIFPSRN